MSDPVRETIEASVAVKQQLLDGDHIDLTHRVADVMTDALRAGNKILFCGNGGSAADAMHLAAELVGRFQLDRSPLPALSLGDNIASVTAIGNDYAFDETFARQIHGLARPGDVLVCLSTSGTSPNVLAAARAARELDVRAVAFTGASGGELGELVDVCVRIPSDSTARIQEGYMLLCHAACHLVERALFAEG